MSDCHDHFRGNASFVPSPGCFLRHSLPIENLFVESKVKVGLGSVMRWSTQQDAGSAYSGPRREKLRAHRSGKSGSESPKLQSMSYGDGAEAEIATWTTPRCGGGRGTPISASARPRTTWTDFSNSPTPTSHCDVRSSSLAVDRKMPNAASDIVRPSSQRASTLTFGPPSQSPSWIPRL